MNYRIFRSKLFCLTITTCCTLLVLISGCGPTYPSGTFVESISKVCKEEYGVDVKVKKTGKTLGVYIPLEGLFESSVEIDEEASLDEILSGLKFSPETSRKIDDVCMSVSRVCLSTDCPVDFYVVIAADTEVTGAQIILTRHVTDIKRILTGDISRGDFIQRMLMDVGYDPTLSAQDLTKNLFRDLETENQTYILSKYFTKTTNLHSLSSTFFLILSELDLKSQKQYAIKDIKSARISYDQVLMFCKTEEQFSPKPGYERHSFLYPREFENEYLVLLNFSIFPYAFIEEFVPLYSIDKNGKVTRKDFPRRFEEFQDPATWEAESFFLEEVEMPDFLARQIANRIRTKFQEDKDLALEFILNLSEGKYVKQSLTSVSEFEFSVDLQQRDFPNLADRNQKMREAEAEIFKIICQVLRRYEFDEFGKVKLINITNNRSEAITRGELLKNYKPRWLRWKKFK